MVKMKKEEIDDLITESIIKTNSCDILQPFINNINNMVAAFNANNTEFNDFSILFVSAIQTALFGSVDVIREVLYKLCCEDGETENTDEVSETKIED